MTENQKHLVTITAGELMDRQLIPRHKHYPGVHLRITNDSTPQAVNALIRGQKDFAVVTTPFDVKKPLKETSLISYREILICGSQYQHLSAELRRLQDVKRYPFVCLGNRTSTFTFYQRLFLKHDLTFHVDMEAATMDQVLPMIQHNLGIGFHPEPVAASSIVSGKVSQIRLVEPVSERSFSLIEDTTRTQSVAMKALKKLLSADAEQF